MFFSLDLNWAHQALKSTSKAVKCKPLIPTPASFRRTISTCRSFMAECSVVTFDVTVLTRTKKKALRLPGIRWHWVSNWVLRAGSQVTESPNSLLGFWTEWHQRCYLACQRCCWPREGWRRFPLKGKSTLQQLKLLLQRPKNKNSSCSVILRSVKKKTETEGI